MRLHLLATGLLGVLCLSCQAAEPLPSCAQIRAEIAAQTGTLPKPNTDLLRKLSDRPDCAFTAAEAYRAVLGETPPPQSEAKERHAERKGEHDDD